MSWQKYQIYNMHLGRVLAEGWHGVEAERIARERTEDDYWELVDRGLQQTKDLSE